MLCTAGRARLDKSEHGYPSNIVNHLRHHNVGPCSAVSHPSPNRWDLGGDGTGLVSQTPVLQLSLGRSDPYTARLTALDRRTAIALTSEKYFLGSKYKALAFCPEFADTSVSSRDCDCLLTNGNIKAFRARLLTYRARILHFEGTLAVFSLLQKPM